VSDLFPGVVLPTPDYDQLTVAMKKQCSNMNLQPTEYFLMKTIQLYEMIVVRHGLMTVGQPFSGKSRSMQVNSGSGSGHCSWPCNRLPGIQPGVHRVNCSQIS